MRVFHRRVENSGRRVRARATEIDARTSGFGRSASYEAVMVARVAGGGSAPEESEVARELQRKRVVAREAVVGGRVSGFLSREVVEHGCGVGLIRRGMDLHRSEKLSHGFA